MSKQSKRNPQFAWLSYLHKVLPKVKNDNLVIDGFPVPRLTGEFWSSKQRQSNALHEISYRACFKGELPNFFIKLLTVSGDTVYDPFNGRGTTTVEAALLHRKVIGNDINPLSAMLSEPRLWVPDLTALEERIKSIPFDYRLKADIDLSMFYEKRTESEIVSLKKYFLKKGNDTPLDRWIRMVATNRLTGHSKNFFSVYTMPPNLSVSQKRQVKINKQKGQKPAYKNVKEIILKKSKDLLKDMDSDIASQLKKIAASSCFLNKDARDTPEIKSNSVQLTVTSPPFLNIVQYADDNWLRNWFNGIDPSKVNITMSKNVADWSSIMLDVLRELYRITKVGGFVAFEVGEVQNGKVNLDEVIIPLGIEAGFGSAMILVNAQNFTKTANIWGVSNNKNGTNTNRIALFQKNR